MELNYGIVILSKYSFENKTDYIDQVLKLISKFNNNNINNNNNNNNFFLIQ